MSSDAENLSRKVTRRAILASTLAIGSSLAGVSSVNDGKHGSVQRSSRESVWDSGEVDLLAPLTRANETRGILRKHESAFPVAEVSEVLELTNVDGTGKSWFAVALIGITNQLQILDPSKKSPIYVINLPEGHDGGIGSMAWDSPRRRLFLSSANQIYSWGPNEPEVVSKVTSIEEATYLYGVKVDSLGRLWMGGYPTGAVYRFDPLQRKLHSTGKLAPDTDYARTIILDKFDNVWAGTGSKNPRLFVLSVHNLNSVKEVLLPAPQETGFVTSLHSFGAYIVVSASGITEQMVYDLRTKSWGHPLLRVWEGRNASNSVRSGSTEVFYSVTDGSLYKTRIDDWTDARIGNIPEGLMLNINAKSNNLLTFYKVSGGLKMVSFSPISMTIRFTVYFSLTSGNYAIQSLMGSSSGKIYLGAFMGKGINSIDADTGERWSSPDDEGRINQIEGMIEAAGRIFVGSYGYADLICVNLARRDDPESYVLLERLDRRYNQSRPFGWAANSKSVFFGTVPDYGRSGGVFGKISLRTNEIEWVLDGGGKGFVESHSVIGLVADEEFVYGTTSVRNGYGTPDTKGPSKVFKFDIVNKRLLWITSPVIDTGALYSPKLIGGWLLVADIEGIVVIDPDNGTMVRKHRLSNTENSNRRAGWASADIAISTDGKIVHSAADTTTVVDFLTRTKSTIGSREHRFRFGYRITALPDGRVFGVYKDTDLVELDLMPRR
ncbi:hypothetical protein [Glutamicibacter nicotianae]|uniref:hypothetical protein n=1 Tax=Glutamicibacter nicotianae TaxID=37929 RepID=UPI0013CE8CA9|nr:hypothetical protein [Glutamicibacter nicotianae]